MPTREDLLLEKRRYELEEIITEDEQKMLDEGYPVQKIIGYVDFFDTIIDISHNVLIPRYETEEMVYLFYLNEREKIAKGKNKILDLCSGSGCIGLSLKNNLGNRIQITLSDIETEAIEQIKFNAKKLGVAANIIQSDLFKNIHSKYDYIICNPPYISKKEQLSNSVLDFEPHNALFAEDDGYRFYEEIFTNLNNYLNPDGKLYLEISDYIYGKMINRKYPYKIEYFKDISDKWRFAIVSFK